MKNMQKWIVRIIVILLVLAMIVPMLLSARADTVEAKPIYGLGWSDYNNIKYPYMEGLVTLRISNIGDKIIISYGGAKLMYGSFTDADVEKMANALKTEMDRRAEGMRYIHFWGPKTALDLAATHVVYLDFGVDQLTAITSALFKKYHEIGGRVDGAMMSALYTGMSSYYINAEDAKKDPLIYSKIVKDPRYATEIRPLLEERGFKFYEKPTDHTPEIYGISGKAGSAYSSCQAIWDTVMKIRLNNYISEWAYEPMVKYFPNVHVSDYQSTDTDAWVKPISNSGGVGGGGGNSQRVGNTSCENFYSGRPTEDFYSDSGLPIYKDVPTYMHAVYENTSFKAFLYDMNVAKRTYNADAENQVSFWVSRFNGGKDNNTAVTGTPYYSEQYYHLCMYDPKPFVVFLARDQFASDEAFDLCVGVSNELMTEVNRMVGYADRKPIAMPQDWNSEFVISGAYANGRNIWRITPNRDMVSKADFLVEGKDPTFSVGGQTVTFPGGKILEDVEISHIGTVGYWVETAKDVTPIVKTDADRFEKFPAYLEGFESYEVGTKLVAMNIRDQGGWIVQPKGSDLVVTADGENKVLAITGNSLLQNKLIPANVTVGDIYAPDQAWEITVTVPEGMQADAEITLLDYEGTKQTAKDGGFKLSGGKIWYSDNGEYKEMTALTPGKYVFRRVLDFHKAGAYTCDYILLDGNGNQLKQVENVAIPYFTGKVSSVGITCKKMNVTLLLDNYILRASGAAADLYLYDTTLGMKVAADTLRDKSTTYRMSWANASGKDETASVVAAYYAGDTLQEEKVLQELTLKPGCDGVEYGTVEVPQGQSVKIYLKTSVQPVVAEAPTEPSVPTTPTTQPTTPAESQPTQPATVPDTTGEAGGSTLLIVAIAVAVVAVIGVVLALVLTKKKKN